MRIVINGFGRIGRTILRQILSQTEHGDIEVVSINDITPIETCAYLFQYDSTFGPYPAPVTVDQDHLVVGTYAIGFTQSGSLAGQDLSRVDVVLECTGHVSSRSDAEHGLAAGARSVLMSGPSEFADVTLIIGANDGGLGNARIVANSSCTTNAIAPLLRAIDGALDIERAHITTIHCYTSSQPMVDSPRANLARSRAGAESIVPTSTSAASELAKVLPEIARKSTVAAVRVPSLSVSAIDATLQLKSAVGPAVNDLLKAISGRTAVIGFTEDACVSRDMRARPESLVLALPETMTTDATQLRIFGWYDNEWGFSTRMIEMARKMAARPQKQEGAHDTQ